MWAFFDFGLLMPALVPAKVAGDADVLAWTNNGEYELQVRGRVEEHLRYFMDTYMVPGSFNPTIHDTPQMDYNYRFYTTREAYAEGIKQAALAIDYEKFKVTSERYSWNHKYHTALNSIWATLCRLNTPGGFYGPKSDKNPYGYTSKHWWDDDDTDFYTNRHDTATRRTGDTFGLREEDSNVFFADRGDEGYTDGYLEQDLGDLYNESMDWMPENERRMLDVIEELDSANIPMRDWADYTSPAEFVLLQPMLKENFSKKTLRSFRKKNKRANTATRRDASVS